MGHRLTDKRLNTMMFCLTVYTGGIPLLFIYEKLMFAFICPDFRQVLKSVEHRFMTMNYAVFNGNISVTHWFVCFRLKILFFCVLRSFGPTLDMWNVKRNACMFNAYAPLTDHFVLLSFERKLSVYCWHSKMSK